MTVDYIDVIIGTAMGWFSLFLLEEIFLIYWIVGIVLNIVAVSVEAFTRGHYKNRRTLLKLCFFAILEPLFYHWINSFIYVLANFKLVFLRKKGWGKMDRVGLTKAPPAALSVPIPSHFREKVH